MAERGRIIPYITKCINTGNGKRAERILLITARGDKGILVIQKLIIVLRAVIKANVGRKSAGYFQGRDRTVGQIKSSLYAVLYIPRINSIQVKNRIPYISKGRCVSI